MANNENDTTNSGIAELVKGFKMFGTVKEIGVDDEGLAAFYNDHFKFPLYNDDGLVLYNDFFGKRKLWFTTYNPFKLYSGYMELKNRLAQKKIEGNLGRPKFVNLQAFLLCKLVIARIITPQLRDTYRHIAV